jgi:hypothetical protein
MKPPEVGARNCDWSYESLVCQRTNFIELKVNASSHEDADTRRQYVKPAHAPTANNRQIGNLPNRIDGNYYPLRDLTQSSESGKKHLAPSKCEPRALEQARQSVISVESSSRPSVLCSSAIWEQLSPQAKASFGRSN